MYFSLLLPWQKLVVRVGFVVSLHCRLLCAFGTYCTSFPRGQAARSHGWHRANTDAWRRNLSDDWWWRSYFWKCTSNQRCQVRSLIVAARRNAQPYLLMFHFSSLHHACYKSFWRETVPSVRVRWTRLEHVLWVCAICSRAQSMRDYLILLTHTTSPFCFVQVVGWGTLGCLFWCILCHLCFSAGPRMKRIPIVPCVWSHTCSSSASSHDRNCPRCWKWQLLCPTLVWFCKLKCSGAAASLFAFTCDLRICEQPQVNLCGIRVHSQEALSLWKRKPFSIHCRHFDHPALLSYRMHFIIVLYYAS